MDGVDAALVSFDDGKINVLGTATMPYSESLRERLLRAIRPDCLLSLHELASLNVSVGRYFADAAQELLDQTNTHSTDVVAIGSHGQTLRHSPNSDPPYSVQIGDPATIATRCAITTVADFRALDIAAGGQGAPLVPAFHAANFRDRHESRVVINIGGIANITALPAAPSDAIEGFDTGPGNCLLDDWIGHHLKRPYDENGHWAASGRVSESLLNYLMRDEFIQRPSPKSTGREYFNLGIITNALAQTGTVNLAAEDVQATLAQFTVASIKEGIARSLVTPDRILICGGGVKNGYLMTKLIESLPNSEIESTAALNIDPDAIEALAFAWMAMRRIESKPVRITTDDSKPARMRMLGAVYKPSR